MEKSLFLGESCGSVVSILSSQQANSDSKKTSDYINSFELNSFNHVFIIKSVMFFKMLLTERYKMTTCSVTHNKC